MTMSESIRLVHRWLPVAFTFGVIVYITTMMRGRQAPWLGLLPLVPLILLLVSGLYLFARPYALGWRRGRVLSW